MCCFFDLTVILNKKNRYLFSGIAYERSDDFEKSMNAYKSATKLQPTNPNAWKGILGLCEKTKDGQLYLTATIGLITCYEKTEDLIKAVDSFEKAKRFIRKYPGKTTAYDILEVQLPNSPIYSFMSGRFPPPDQIYCELATLYEKEESAAKSKFNFRNIVSISKQGGSRNDALYGLAKNSRVC